MNIVPAILVSTYPELQKQLKKTKPFFEYVQLDIMDGQFVSNRSFNYNDNRDLAEFFNRPDIVEQKYELHLMVRDPLAQIKKWQNVKGVFRVIFHLESDCAPLEVIDAIKKNNWQAGLALNPDTELQAVLPFNSQINQVLFMTVYPGQQGSKFLPKMENKITKFSAVPNHPTIAIDGGINLKTIKQVAGWGVEIFNVGSALMKADDINLAREQLLNQITN
ncbi:MAG: hypothetical protein COU31_02835 [Candidatus Magasanikbacteria bacterium CG10_big_fil_rev_8_21_14_0_10_40_10]|uniref:Ribulose-phosphate 3-epimerase n=1 Tax=Candidatus Magasanikbacteria bacterium CG10_big_fil_rev_8_21_14_0_10_40_10 TaxID=1974648 RepID=A0A2M6W3V5_9BACT|nr:MAG: hypothetical protein COU31_02835 [Candidatus Magasanikbacteria bacterium CG10_big_fil_rev_8_21_14_0_10_40_10]